ncbi:MAG: hypothetical protein Q4D41_05355 [Prevotellaceae bacterium]|nr:hypothetical protein [Prevotellaceae bacterium]
MPERHQSTRTRRLGGKVYRRIHNVASAYKLYKPKARHIRP